MRLHSPLPGTTRATTLRHQGRPIAHAPRNNSAQAGNRAMAPTQAPVLVSFDVDGTLLRSVNSEGIQANKLHKDAYKYGFKHVCGLDTDIDQFQHHGSTDPLIVVLILEHFGYSKEEAMAKVPQVQDAMIEYYNQHAADGARAVEGIEILPGVSQLLKALKEHGGAATCLVTGNLEPIGWGKMKALGILDLFTTPNFGGFATDYCSGNTAESWRDRADLVRFASHKGRACLAGKGVAGLNLPSLVGSNAGLDEGWGARVHVGDTPMDIKAALAAGAKALGVATGVFTKAELEAVAPGDPNVVVMENFADTAAVMAVLGLK